MKVLIAHSTYREPGGEDRYVDQLIDLLGTVHDVEVFRPRNDQLEGGLRDASAMLHGRGQAQRIERLMTTFRPALVHLHNPYPSLGPAVHVAARRTHTPLVFTVHNHRLRCPNGFMFTEGQPCTRCESGNYGNAVTHKCFPSRAQASAYATTLWLHRFVLRLEKRVSLFLAPSRYMAAKLAEWHIPKERIALARNFTTPVGKRAGKSGAYGIYVGRLSSEKGLMALLDALRSAGDPPFRIVGDGPLMEPLRRRARELDLASTSFPGRVDRAVLTELLSGARFLAMPSQCAESAGLAALEAMSVGLPLLVSDRGGLRELVQDARQICGAEQTDEWAASIKWLMESDEDCTDLGAQALRAYEDRFTPEAALRTLDTCYERTLSLAPVSGPRHGESEGA